MIEDQKTELAPAEVEFALLVFRGVVFANGGAAVALITLLIAVAEHLPQQSPLLIKWLIAALSLFVLGVWSAITASGLAYLAQLGFVNSQKRFGQTLRSAAVALVAVGLLAFAVGAGLTAYGLRVSLLP